MAEKEEYIVESKVSQSPKEGKRKRFILGEDVIDTKHLKKGCVTADKLSGELFEGIIEIVADRALRLVAENLISDKFGNSTEVSISQKLITNTINDIYGKIRDINGEPPAGLYMNITPEYFIGEEGAHVHIEAISTSGVFEYVEFFLDDEPIEGAKSKSVYRFAWDIDIDKTSTIRCDASILGVDYTTQKTIIHYNSFWLGAGNSYQDVMNTSHIIPVEGLVKGAYNVDCNEGDHFIIILGDHLKDSFFRADLNGFEIPFTVSKITVEGNDYWVYTSENVYNRGTYNIDINS